MMAAIEPPLNRRSTRTTLVWLLLMAVATVSTWGVSAGDVAAPLAAVMILLIAAFKIRLVQLHFMGLRDAPLLPRLYFEVWTFAVAGAVLGIYFSAKTGG